MINLYEKECANIFLYDFLTLSHVRGTLSFRITSFYISLGIDNVIAMTDMTNVYRHIQNGMDMDMDWNIDKDIDTNTNLN